MELFYFFTSTRRPAGGTPVLSAQAVREKLISINRPSASFQLIDGASQGVDVVAEWKIVDANWLEIFSQAGLSKAFAIHLKLDANEHTVRALDRELSIEWRAGSFLCGKRVQPDFDTSE